MKPSPNTGRGCLISLLTFLAITLFILRFFYPQDSDIEACVSNPKAYGKQLSKDCK